MKHILMLAGAATLAFAGPAFAKPGHANKHGHVGAYGYGNGHCPPGLAKKNPQCMPPGQHKKIYGVGQRLPLGFGTPYGFNQIPYDLRSQYGLSPYGNYYYGDGYLYRVDPRTMLIQQVVSALLR